MYHTAVGISVKDGHDAEALINKIRNEDLLTSIQTIDFRNTWEKFIEQNFDGLETNQILAAVDWEAWMYESTLAPNRFSSIMQKPTLQPN